MRVKELIAVLSSLPPEAVIIVEWESTLNTITADGIDLQETTKGRQIVVIDADGGMRSGSTGERVYDLDDEELV